MRAALRVSYLISASFKRRIIG